MDGVLVDTEPLYRQNNFAVFARLGIHVTDEEYADFVGTAAEVMWRKLKARFRLPHPVPELVRMESDQQYASLLRLERLEPVAGIPELLTDLRAAGLRLGVASCSTRPVVALTLEKAGLARRFDAVVSGDEVRRGKPDPEIFFAAAGALGAPPRACLVIEDSPRGLAGAHAAGMRVVGFANPNSGRHDLSAADLVVAGFGPEERRQILHAALGA